MNPSTVPTGLRLNDLVEITNSKKHKGKTGVLVKINSQFCEVKIKDVEKNVTVAHKFVKVRDTPVMEMPHEDQLQPVMNLPVDEEVGLPESADVGGLDSASPKTKKKLKKMATHSPPKKAKKVTKNPYKKGFIKETGPNLKKEPEPELSDHESEDEPIDITNDLPTIDEALSLKKENQKLKDELKMRKEDTEKHLTEVFKHNEVFENLQKDNEQLKKDKSRLLYLAQKGEKQFECLDLLRQNYEQLLKEQYQAHSVLIRSFRVAAGLHRSGDWRDPADS